jgi:hypothetical protein
MLGLSISLFDWETAYYISKYVLHAYVELDAKEKIQIGSFASSIEE